MLLYIIRMWCTYAAQQYYGDKIYCFKKQNVKISTQTIFSVNIESHIECVCTVYDVYVVHYIIQVDSTLL